MSALRPATPADLDALTALEQAAFEGHGPWSRAQLAALLARADHVALLLPGPDGAAVGAAVGWSAGGVGELLRVAVDPAARRAGRGGLLLHGFMAACRARGAEELWLEVRADNVPALALYQRGGWEETGRRPRYYADGEAAVLMTCFPARAQGRKV